MKGVRSMSANAKLLMLGFIILIDMYIILKNEWNKLDKK